MEVVIVLISFIPCYLISTMVHELGHIICGLFYRWKLFMLVVGPIKIYRETMDSKIKIGIEKNIIMWFGVGGTLPTKESKDNIKIWGKILLAGPLSSIMFSIIMLPFLIITKNIIFLLLTLMPFSMGIMCLIPMKLKTGILYNDGTRYKRIKSGGQEEQEEESIFKLVEISIIDGKNSLYPIDLIKPLLNSKDYALKYYGYYYSYQNARNNSDVKEVDTQLSNMKNIQNKVPKAIIDDCKIEN